MRGFSFESARRRVRESRVRFWFFLFHNLLFQAGCLKSVRVCLISTPPKKKTQTTIWNLFFFLLSPHATPAPRGTGTFSVSLPAPTPTSVITAVRVKPITAYTSCRYHLEGV